MHRLLFLVSAIPLLGQEAFFHVSKAGNGFETKLVLENREVYGLQYTYVVRAYDEQGNLLADTTFFVYNGGALPRLRTITMADINADRELISHLSVRSERTPAEENTHCYLFYEASNGEGSPVTVGPTFHKAHEWQLFPSNWETTADGIAVINRGSEATNVMVQQVDYYGNVLATIVIEEDLAPLGKTTFILGAPGNTPFLAQQDTFFKIVSQPSEVFVTSINANAQAFWMNHVTPVLPQDWGKAKNK